jgi:hypothetical protein
MLIFLPVLYSTFNHIPYSAPTNLTMDSSYFGKRRPFWYPGGIEEKIIGAVRKMGMSMD